MLRRPLSLVAVGLVLAVVDFRIVHVDLLPDALGWLLVLVAAWLWGERPPALLAGVATLAALPDAALTYHYDDLDPLTGEVVVNGGGTDYPQRLAFDRITDVRAVLAIVALAAGGLAVYLLAARLEERAEAGGDHVAARQLWLAKILVAAAWVLPHVGIMAFQWLSGDGVDPVWNDGLELVALVGMAVGLTLAVGATVNRNRGWTATAAERRDPDVGATGPGASRAR